jgi:hypothetical protein
MNKYSPKRLELANTSLLYLLLNKTEHILQNNKCDKCRLTIHPDFIGYHKCGYANCPICKNAIINSQYWFHIRSRPGHENDSPFHRERTFNSRQGTGTQHSTERWS